VVLSDPLLPAAAVNVPLKAGIGDEAYVELFAQVVSGIVTRYSPQAVVLQWYGRHPTSYFLFINQRVVVERAGRSHNHWGMIG
jgi:hypothetical protein